MSVVEGSPSTWIGDVILIIVYGTVSLGLMIKYRLSKSTFDFKDRRHAFVLYVFCMFITAVIGTILHKVYGGQYSAIGGHGEYDTKIWNVLLYASFSTFVFMMGLIVQPIWLLFPNHYFNENLSWKIWVTVNLVIGTVVFFVDTLLDNLTFLILWWSLLVILLIISSILSSLKYQKKCLSSYVYIYIMILLMRMIPVTIYLLFYGRCLEDRYHIGCPFNGKYLSLWALLHVLQLLETVVLFIAINLEYRTSSTYQTLSVESETEIEIDSDDNCNE